MENCRKISIKSSIEWQIKISENSPDEINDAVNENYFRLKGLWKENNEANKLQNKFWSLFPHRIIKSKTLRIGSDFLLKNPELLN